jgi:MEDS: MEthanogen/methylotroph, DcmR Sensory domain
VADPWGAFLAAGESAATHGVELYTRDEDLVQTAATFLGQGIADGAPGVVVATPAHATAITELLAERGHDGSRLVFLDAHQACDSFFEDGVLSRAAFDRVTGGLLDLARRNGPGHIRVFGEVVDLLCRRGDRESALQIEHWCEEALVQRPCSVMCAYHLDVFDVELQQDLVPALCNTHTHVRPANDLQRFTLAVERALGETLGPERARDVYYVVDRPLRASRVPVAQDALRYVTASFPDEAEAVLSAARGYYADVEAA